MIMDVGCLFRIDLHLVSLGEEPLEGSSAFVKQKKGK